MLKFLEENAGLRNLSYFASRTAVRRESHPWRNSRRTPVIELWCHTVWDDKRIFNIYAGSVSQTLVRKVEFGSNLKLPKIYFRPQTVSVYFC